MTINVYRQFKDIFPDKPLQVATVTAIEGGGSTVVLGNGNTLYVRGVSVAVGKNVYIRDGAIEGPAPDTSETQIEI